MNISSNEEKRKETVAVVGEGGWVTIAINYFQSGTYHHSIYLSIY